jgi:hypothetical protein
VAEVSHGAVSAAEAVAEAMEATKASTQFSVVKFADLKSIFFIPV